MNSPSALTHRLATMDDLPTLHALMDVSIRKLIGALLTPEEVEASFELMGVDTNLISDGTYFVIEQNNAVVGCGGWSRRATLFGADHTVGRDARLLNPLTESARVRAMYTHPDHARKGIGHLLLTLCEEAARREGFTSLELMSTVAGEPLYLKYGFREVERKKIPTSNGIGIPLVLMAKLISRPE